MKNVKTTTIKMRHRSLALLLLILIAFSSASCNVEEIVLSLKENTNEPTAALNTENLSEDTEEPTELPTEDVTEPEVIIPYNEEIEAEIQKKYWDQFIASKPGYEEITYEWFGPSEVQFLGQFGNAYAVHVIDQSVHGKRGVYYVEGYEFRYLAERQTYVYVNQTFLTLEQALKNNVITKEDLGSIHSEFKRMNAEEYKYIFEYDERYDIVLGQITIRIQPQYNDKLYTVDDFADVGCTKIEEHKVYGKVEPHHIYRGFTLYFDVDTKEETLRIGKILEAREDLLWATPIYLVPGDSVPNDSEYGSLSSDNYWAINKISLPQAWDEITGKSTIKIGIIDRGVDATHPDLQNRVNTALSTCFLENCSCKGIDTSGRHGTAVAGIIGAQANNSIGVSGVCWNIQLVSLRVAHTEEGSLNYQHVIQAITYAEENEIKILNISASGPYDSELKTAIEEYSGLVVCSAGNTSDGGKNIDLTGGLNKVYPIAFDCKNIIGVGASTPTDGIKSNSNYGVTSVDLFAPGVDILTTYPIALCRAGTCGYDHSAEGAFSEGYHYFQNTSAATPFVAGVAALILSKDSYYSTTFLKQRIQGYVDKTEAFEGLCAWGGRLNAYRSVHITHSYDDSCSQYDSSNHKVSCVCGEYKLQSHTYTQRYAQWSAQAHKAYCKCGAYTTEAHSTGNPNSSGVATCTKCGYGVQLWGGKPETETE